jgi:hypothetical protein
MVHVAQYRTYSAIDQMRLSRTCREGWVFESGLSCPD